MRAAVWTAVSVWLVRGSAGATSTTTETVAVTGTQTYTVPTATATATTTLPTATTTETDFRGSCAQVPCGVPRSLTVPNATPDLSLDGEWNWAGSMARCHHSHCTPAECCSLYEHPHENGSLAAWAPVFTLHEACNDSNFASGGTGRTVWGYGVNRTTEQKCGELCYAQPSCYGFKWVRTAGHVGDCSLADAPLEGCSRSRQGSDCTTTDCQWHRRVLLPWFMPFTDTNATFETVLPLDDSSHSCGGGAMLTAPMLNVSPAACLHDCHARRPQCLAVTWRELPPSPLLGARGYTPTVRDFSYSECQLWSELHCEVPDWVCLGEHKSKCVVSFNASMVNGTVTAAARPSDPLALVTSTGLCPAGGPCFYLVRSEVDVCDVSLADYVLHWGPVFCLVVFGMLCCSSGVWMCWNMRRGSGPAEGGAKRARPCCMLFIIAGPLMILMVVPWAFIPSARVAMIEGCPNRAEPWWGVNLGLPNLAATPEITSNFTADRGKGTVRLLWARRFETGPRCGEVEDIGEFWASRSDCFSPDNWGSVRLPGVLQDISVIPTMPAMGRYDISVRCVDNVTEVDPSGGPVVGGRIVREHEEVSTSSPYGLLSQYRSKDGTCAAPSWELLAPSVQKATSDRSRCSPANFSSSESSEVFVTLQCSKCVWLLWVDVLNAPFQVMVINSFCSLFFASVVWMSIECWSRLVAKIRGLCPKSCGGKEPEEEGMGEAGVLTILGAGLCPCCFRSVRSEVLGEVLEDADFDTVGEGDVVFLRETVRDAHRASSVDANVDASALDYSAAEISEIIYADSGLHGAARVAIKVEFLREAPGSWASFMGRDGKRMPVYVDRRWWLHGETRRLTTGERRSNASIIRQRLRDKFSEKYDDLAERTREWLLKWDNITDFTKATSAPPVAFILLKTVFLIFFFAIGTIEVQRNNLAGIDAWAKYQILYTRQVNSGTPLLLVEAFRGALQSVDQLKRMDRSAGPGGDDTSADDVRSTAVQNIAATAVATVFFLPPIVTHVVPMIFAFPWLGVVLYVFGWQMLMELPQLFFEWLAEDWKALVNRSPLKARFYSLVMGVTLKFTASFLIGLPLQMFYNYGVQLYAGFPYWDIPIREIDSRDWACFFEQGIEGKSLAGSLQFISFWF